MWWPLDRHEKYFEQIFHELDDLKKQLFHDFADIHKENHEIMSAITDWAAQEEADLTAISTTLDGVVAGVENLDTLIQQLQNGNPSAADQAALDAVKSASAALVTKAAAISTAPPVAPAV